MSLLELRHVRHRARGSRGVEVLRDVSLEIDAGELVAVWGSRRSGRSTLLAVAAGVEGPESGVVLFEGHDLKARGARLLGERVGYCAHDVNVAGRRSVIDNVRAGLLACGIHAPAAYARACEVLARVGVERFNGLLMGDLDAAEAARVAIACALVHGPRVLVIDEPTKGVDLLDRDKIVLLLRSLAKEGIAVLVSDGDGSGLADADRALTLADGELRGRRSPAVRGTVVPLHAAGNSSAL